MQTAAHRAEERVPIKVVVDMASLDIRLPAQEGVTENISTRGARVVYCEPLRNGCYAVGLQLFAPIGSWRSPN